MKVLVDELLFGRDAKLSGLIALSIFGMIALGCSCGKDFNFANVDNSITLPSTGTEEEPRAATELDREFLADPWATTEKYKGLKMFIRGEVHSTASYDQSHETIVLNEKAVYCMGAPYQVRDVGNFNAKIDGISKLQAGDEVTVSGIYNYQSSDRLILSDCRIIAFRSAPNIPSKSTPPDETPVEVRASTLLDEYKRSPPAALRKYEEGRMVLVSGTIDFTQETRLMLGGSVSCMFSESESHSIRELDRGQGVRLLGKSAGFRYATNRLGTTRTPYLELTGCKVIPG